MARKTDPVDRRLRILWNSNSVWAASGYGIETRDLLWRFMADGWTLAQSIFYGLEGSAIDYTGCDLDPHSLIYRQYPLRCYPKMADTWGSDAMWFHSQSFNAHVVFSMQDIWPIDPNYLQRFKYWIPYVPIDQAPAPDGVINNLRYAYKIISFSEFGQKELEKRGFTSTLIREGTDVNIFRPHEKQLARIKFGLPQDKFVVGMIGANKENPPRKGWQEALEAFKLFHDNHPEAVFFYQSNQPAPTGFPIQRFAEHLGIQKELFHIDDYLAIFHSGSEVMNALMNAFDMMIHPSLNEGFGLVIAEALASGTPIIGNDCTSMTELLKPLEDTYPSLCEKGKYWYSPQGGRIYFANVESLHQKMEELYTKIKKDEAKLSQACRDYAVREFDIDKIVKDKWLPLLSELQDDILGKPTGDNRAPTSV